MVRVMVIGPTDADSFADNVGDTLKRMGHEVLMAGPVRRHTWNRQLASAHAIFSERMPGYDRRRQQHLLKAEREFRPDIIITLDRRIQPAVVRDLRQHGARIALWFPDAVSNLGRHDLFLAPYDRLYFKNPQLVEQLSSLHGLPAVYLPEAANSSWHHSQLEYGVDEFIVVAGNIHPTRGILLERLLEAGVPLKIFGPWPARWMNFPHLESSHSGRSVTRQEKANVFRRARGVLNNLHPAEFAGTNCRLFEATASGAVVLTEVRSGLTELFDTETEVLPFFDFEDLVTKCQALVADASVGREMAEKAAIRARRDHVYEVRLAQILADLELK